MRKQTLTSSLYTLWYGVLHLCLLSDNSTQARPLLKAPHPLTQVWLSRTHSWKAGVLLSDGQTCTHHENIAKWGVCLKSCVISGNGCRLWTAVLNTVGGNSSPVAPNNSRNPDATVNNAVNIQICAQYSILVIFFFFKKAQLWVQEMLQFEAVQTPNTDLKERAASRDSWPALTHIGRIRLIKSYKVNGGGGGGGAGGGHWATQRRVKVAVQQKTLTSLFYLQYKDGTDG